MKELCLFYYMFRLLSRSETTKYFYAWI